MRLHDTEQRALNVASVVVVPSHHALRALESGFRVTRPVVVAEPGVDPAPVSYTHLDVYKRQASRT